jgi:hypothetical protein
MWVIESRRTPRARFADRSDLSGCGGDRLFAGFRFQGPFVNVHCRMVREFDGCCATIKSTIAKTLLALAPLFDNYPLSTIRAERWS